MRIDQRQLFVVMRIGAFIARRLAGILHARCGHIRAEILVLVTKPIVMTDLLTRHQLAPGVVVVAILIEIVIVEQRCPASDVTAGDSNAGKTEPADRTVVIIADIDLVAHDRASGIGIPSNQWRFDIWRNIPVSDRNPRMVALGPDAGGIVYYGNRDLIAGPDPVISAPGMVCQQRRPRCHRAYRGSCGCKSLAQFHVRQAPNQSRPIRRKSDLPRERQKPA